MHQEVKKYIGFTRNGENLIGIPKRATRLMEEDALEIGPGGIVQPCDAAQRTTY